MNWCSVESATGLSARIVRHLGVPLKIAPHEGGFVMLNPRCRRGSDFANADAGSNAARMFAVQLAPTTAAAYENARKWRLQ